ncbi:MAG TPA: ABC transporter permease [Gemmatimonadales bacterium]|jgi:ABC-type multidrug transport system permease subunit|nr:ABC transporter permease [Gemmatimonadales bacterium]
MTDLTHPGPAPRRIHPLAQLTLVRYLEFVREPEAVFWVFIFPVLLAAGLGIAFRSRPAERMAVAVPTSTPGAEGLAAALRHDDRLTVRVLDDSTATRALRVGDVALLLAAADSGRIEYRYDDRRPESRTARLIVDDAIQRAAGRRNPIGVVDRQVSEPGSRYIDFVVPGLLGMNLMGSGIWGIGFSIVDARRKRLLKRLIATPMSRPQYLASFVLSRLTWLVLEVGLLLGFAVLVFGVPVRGSLLELAVICLLSALSFASIGLLLASRARTVEGVSGLMNLVMLPMWIFSGVFFSASRFPDAIQPLIRALPLTAVINALRASMLQGASLRAIALELAVITAWLVVSFPLALRIFRWK